MREEVILNEGFRRNDFSTSRTFLLEGLRVGAREGCGGDSSRGRKPQGMLSEVCSIGVGMVVTVVAPVINCVLVSLPIRETSGHRPQLCWGERRLLSPPARPAFPYMSLGLPIQKGRNRREGLAD